MQMLYFGISGQPSVSAGSTTSLVVWRRQLRRRAPTPDSSPTDGAPLGDFFLLASAGNTPQVAFDGTNYLVTWSNGDIVGKRVAEDGTVLDATAIPISTAAGAQTKPSAAFDGQNFVVAWEDGRSGVDIYGARVDSDGHVLDSDGFPIAAGSSSETSPAAAAGSPGRTAVSYERANRAFLRFVDDGPPPPPPPPPPTATSATTSATSAATAATAATTSSASLHLRRRLRLHHLRRHHLRPRPPPRPRCRVPRVIGMTLVRARRAIRFANCKTGRVRRARSRRVGRVIAQSPRPRSVRPRGTRVNLVVGRR